MRIPNVIYEGETPVEEERARALAVHSVLREHIGTYLEDQQSMRGLSVAAAVAGVVFGLLALSVNQGIVAGAGLILGGLVIGGGGYLYTTTQDPDITVTGLEKGYWTGYTIPDEGGVVVYDATNSVETTTFDLERLGQQEAISTARDRVASLDEFPVVMPHDQNLEEEFTDALETVTHEIETAEQTAVEAPVIPTGTPEASAVREFAARASDDEAVPTDVAISKRDAQTDVEELAELERMAATDEGAAELERVSQQSRDLVDDLSTAQETAVDLLNDHIGVAADAFGLVSYNFYCPECQTDGVESVVELAAPAAGEWYCETCRTKHQTDAVIPRHRIKDDLVNPIWDQLWAEKDDERRQIYENIEDQHNELQEREFEQRREEIRSATDRIRDLRSKIRDLKTEAKAAEGKVEEVGALMVKYDRINRERKEAFRSEVNEAFAEIDRQTAAVLEETRNEEQERIEQAQKAAKEKAKTMREEKRRREVEMHLAAQERADERALAQMDHHAELHDEELELEKQHHQENWMLKTRGRTSFSGKIDEAKLKKDRLLRASVHNGGD